MSRVTKPCHDPLPYLGRTDQTVRVVFQHLAQAARNARDALAQQTTVCWEDQETEERHAVGGAIDDALALMQRETQPVQKPPDRLAEFDQTLAIIAEENKVIAISNVAANAEFLFHEMVEGIEIDVREELAGQIADRQASGAENSEQVIAGE